MFTAIDNHNKAVRINPVAVYGDITRTSIVIQDGIPGNRLWFGSDREWHIDLESDVEDHDISSGLKDCRVGHTGKCGKPQLARNGRPRQTNCLLTTALSSVDSSKPMENVTH